MAARLGSHAMDIGLRLVRLRISTSYRPGTYYLDLRDKADRPWIVRISNHARRDRVPVPHIDLVSSNGLRGEQWGREQITRIAAGAFTWFESAGSHRIPSDRIQRLIDEARTEYRERRKA